MSLHLPLFLFLSLSLSFTLVPCILMIVIVGRGSGRTRGRPQRRCSRTLPRGIPRRPSSWGAPKCLPATTCTGARPWHPHTRIRTHIHACRAPFSCFGSRHTHILTHTHTHRHTRTWTDTICSIASFLSMLRYLYLYHACSYWQDVGGPPHAGAGQPRPPRSRR
jgi:hypothetical protein